MSTCRSLFNLEGAIERLCTFKRGKEKIQILMSLFKLLGKGGVAQLGEHLPCKQGGQEFDPPHLHHRASEDEETTTVARN